MLKYIYCEPKSPLVLRKRIIQFLKKNIKLAKNAGFCYGVKRAVETTKKLRLENKDKNVFVLGELIHNSQVISELDALGIKTINELKDNQSGICIIRSHGASPQVFEEIKQKGYELIDLTCPDVKKVQQKAIQLVQEGFLLIIVGKLEHPEVVAIKANAEIYGNKVIVISNTQELEEVKDQILAHPKIGVVVQTTQRIENLQKILDKLKPMAKELKVFNTICASTAMRQCEARDLAKESDLMIVVGSKKSANTSHLAEILADITKTIHIETEQELELYEDMIEKSANISVTAGASTPENIIENVLNKLKKEK